MSRWLSACVSIVFLSSITVSTQAADEAEVRRQMAAYAAARQEGNGEAQVKFYADDADEWGLATRRFMRGWLNSSSFSNGHPTRFAWKLRTSAS